MNIRTSSPSALALDHSTAKQLDHRLKAVEGDVEEPPVLIEPTFQHDSMEVRIPSKHVTKRLVGND